MSNLPKQILSDINDFRKVTVKECAYRSLLEANKKIATVRTFTGELKRGMRVEDDSKVISSCGHPGNIRFDNGIDGGTYSGQEEITPLLEKWAEERNVDLKNKKSLSVDYADGVHHQAGGFMFNSIPSEAELKAITDRVIKSTLRGGTVYG